MKRNTVFIFVAIAAIGCSGSQQPQVYEGSGKPVATSSNSTGTTPKPELPKVTEKDVPANLKTAAYDYFGCGNESVMDVELRVKGMPTKTGGMTMKLEKIENGAATYAIERTGAIADDLGNEKAVVEPSGIYSTENSNATITPDKNLVLPSDLTPGKTWPSKTKVVRNDGQELEEQSTFKVVGEQSVTTKIGAQKALLVTSSGTANVKMPGGPKKAKYETKSWYVKGRGAVKVVITLTLEGQAPNSVVVEETK
jgi:hypothetical protein